MNVDIEKWFPAGIDQNWQLVLQVFAVVLATALANYFIKKFIGKMLVKLSRTKSRWDDIVFEAMSRPLSWVVWLVGISLAVDMIYIETKNPIFTESYPIRDVGILVCISWFILGLARGAEKEFTTNADSAQLDQHTVEAMGKLVRLAVIITSGLMILQTLGFSISGVLAMGGIGGIAVGFAAKDLLANFFGGLIVYLDRPFKIGEWIRSPDRNIEGTVEKIGWRVTVIRNFESQPIYVPNSIFTNIIVENPSRMLNRRIYETIGLRYSDLSSMEHIVDEVKAMLLAHDAIDTEKTMIVNFNKFADSSADFFVYAFTKTTAWVAFHQVKQEVMLKISHIVENNQAEIAFPTSTLHLADSIKLDRA